MGHSKTGAQAVEASELAHKCVALRVRGLSYEAISRELNCSRSTAYEHINRHLDRLAKETRGDTERVRALELQRLEGQVSRLTERAELAEEARDAAALESALTRVVERACKLLGLDAPTKQQIDLTGKTDEELRADVMAALEADGTLDRWAVEHGYVKGAHE